MKSTCHFLKKKPTPIQLQSIVFMQEYCSVLLDLPVKKISMYFFFIFKIVQNTHTNQTWAKSGTKVISLQPVAQNKVLSVEMKKKNSKHIMKEEL